MVMTLSVYTQLDRLYVIAGYESGHAAVFVQKSRKAAWEKLYMNQSHSQPGKTSSILTTSFALTIRSTLPGSVTHLWVFHHIFGRRQHSKASIARARRKFEK